MDIGIDHDPWLRGSRDAPEKSRDRGGLDWQGLAGRFAAVHAFNRMAVGQQKADPATSGSFAPDAAQWLSAYARGTRDESQKDAAWANGCDAGRENLSPVQSSHAVNPIILADGKSASGIGSGVAGPHPSGTRGLI